MCQRGPLMQCDGRLTRASNLVSVRQAAELLGFSKRYIYVLFKQNKLDWYQVGDRKLVHVRDIDAMLESRRKVS